MAEEANAAKDSDAISPFTLRSFFPDAQGIFDVRYSPLEDVKTDCFVVLDANVLLLPYKLENVSLPDVVATDKTLVDQGRLIIPAQAAREFARHRSAKVAEIVKHLRDESSLGGPRLGKKIGALIGNERYESAKALANSVSEKVKELQNSIKSLADDVSNNVGEDPVSAAYREVFKGVVSNDPADCQDEKGFLEDLETRFKSRRPPGYKDAKKSDAGAGDLIIWKTILAEGAIRQRNCVFVTADEKSDWYVQSSGPFQPRLELIEEYRSASGATLHVVPLSRLLQLFEAPVQAVEDVQRAEFDVDEDRRSRASKFIASVQSRERQRALENELALIDRELASVINHQRGLPPPTGNLSLPWERAWLQQQQAAQALIERKAMLSDELNAELAQRAAGD